MTLIDENAIKFSNYNLARLEIDLPEEDVPLANAISHSHPTTKLLLATKLTTHNPDAGINPLVDSGAYLFSLMGKLKHVRSYRDLAKLQHELIVEIEIFKENAKTHYENNERIAEYIPITCYAVCATFDDIIELAPWGGERWKPYSLLDTFYKDSISHEGFFIILERLIRDPDHYIDIMEFMYLCLNLGFKGQYKYSAHDHEQLEHISNTLYKRIRIFRGDTSKSLSPKILKAKLPQTHDGIFNIPEWAIILLFSGIIILLFTGAQYLLSI